MRTILITIVVIFHLFHIRLDAQNKPFSIRLNPIVNTEDGQQVEILNNKIFIGAPTNYLVNNVKNIGYTLYLTDMNGKEIKNKFYPNLVSPSTNSMSNVTKDRIFNFAMVNFNELQLERKFVITELNHNLDSLNSLYFKPNGNQLTSCIAQYSDSELLTLVIDYNNTNSYLSLIDKTTGAIKWTSKVVDEAIMKCKSFSKIIVDNDKNILVFNKAVKKGKDIALDTRPLLTKFNNKGQKLFSKDYPEIANADYFNSLAILDTATYIFACKGDSDVPGHGGDTIASPPVFYAINKDGSVKWKKYIYGTYPDGVIQMYGFTVTKNGDIVGIGNKEDNDKKPRTGGWMFRLAHDGKMKWSRTIRDEKGLSTAKALIAGELYDVKEGPNGMLYATGLYMDTFPDYKPFVNNNNVWLIGVDSMGCFTPNCNDNQIWTSIKDEAIVSVEQPFKVYPNPAQDRIKVLSLEGFENTDKITYEIYDLQGQLISKGIPITQSDVLDINIAHLASGAYVLKLQTPKINKSFLFNKI